jgi:hypothetical protein
MHATCHCIIYLKDARKRVEFVNYLQNESDNLMCQRASSFYNIHVLIHLMSVPRLAKPKIFFSVSPCSAYYTLALYVDVFVISQTFAHSTSCLSMFFFVQRLSSTVLSTLSCWHISAFLFVCSYASWSSRFCSFYSFVCNRTVMSHYRILKIIFDIYIQPYGPSRPVTRITFYIYTSTLL